MKDKFTQAMTGIKIYFRRVTSEVKYTPCVKVLEFKLVHMLG